MARLALLFILIPLNACILEPSADEVSVFDGSFLADRPGSDSYPIVFSHGFLSSAEKGFSDEIAQALASDGFTVYKTGVPKIDSVANRAAALGRQIEFILAETGALKVHIIAHSMGGLDARYLAARVSDPFGTNSLFSSRIASISTMSTPHRGSNLADIAFGLTRTFDPDQKAATLLLDLSESDNLPAALHDLTEKHAPTFNENTPDQDGVYYQSWAGLSNTLGIVRVNDRAVCEMGLRAKLWVPLKRDRLRNLFVKTAPFLRGPLALIPHDGVVTVRSAKWGEFRGCIPADHLDESKALVDEHTGFDSISFYKEVAAELATIQ